MRTLKIISLFVALLVALMLLAACDASGKEGQQTWSNRNAINDQIPVPPLNFSTRRLVLAKYYLVLERTRLTTCSYLAGRGSFGEALVPTFGPSVNLSNQMTSPGQSEPDSVYVGQNDQTLIVLRNGNFATVEADVVTVGGDCPAGVRPNTFLQAMLENAAGIKPEFDFTTTDGLRKGQ